MIFRIGNCILIVVIGFFLISHVFAHDKHYVVTPQQDSWFKSLKSGKGPCCGGPNVDGTALADADWDSRDGRYRVKIKGEWIDVPDEAVLKQPNLYGQTMVWIHYSSAYGGPLITHVRCFIPGMMT